MSSKTTYSTLTEAAAESLRHGREVIATAGPVDAGTASQALSAHADLAAALAHLGRALVTPLSVTPGNRRSTARRASSGTRLIQGLDRVAIARDWAEPLPTSGPGALLANAALLIRAAADLWATHHTAAGMPRSPEASRMRHPALLGAASREWRSLVVLAGEVADALTDCGRRAGLREDDLGALGRWPRPCAEPRPDSGTSIDITVARPGVRRGQEPLADLADRIDRLRHCAWSLKENESAPSGVLHNLAAIGATLNRAAELAHAAAARHESSADRRDVHAAQCHRARVAADQWRGVSDRVAVLRTPDPTANGIQMERLDISRLLDRILAEPSRQDPAGTAEALSRIAERYADVAEYSLRAMRAAHRRGDLLVTGRAVPSEVIGRRIELLEAKLSDRVVAAPTVVVRRADEAYRAVCAGRTEAPATDANPPAA